MNTKIDRIALYTFIYKKFSINYMMEALKKADVKEIEFHATAPHYCHCDDLPATKQELEDMRTSLHGVAAENDVKIGCFVPEGTDYPINIASEDNYFREKSVRYFLEYLEDLPGLGCDTMLVTPGWDYFDHSPAEFQKAWNRARISLKRIAKRAEELSVTVCLKPVTRTSTNLVYNLKTLVRMITEVGSDNLKASIDLYNLEETGDTIAEYFELFPNKVGYFHCYYNLDEEGKASEEDTKNLLGWLEELNNYGYDGPIGLELNYECWLDPAKYTKLLMDHLREIL